MSAPTRSLPRRMRAWLVPACAGALVFAATAFAASHVYANGALGSGGSWSSGSFYNMNYNRMSVSQNALVIVQMTSINGGDPIGASDTDGFVQQTNPFGLGSKARARCLNNTGGTLNGQCIWYD